jgi:hypothetical protein
MDNTNSHNGSAEQTLTNMMEDLRNRMQEVNQVLFVARRGRRGGMEV